MGVRLTEFGVAGGRGGGPLSDVSSPPSIQYTCTMLCYNAVSGPRTRVSKVKSNLDGRCRVYPRCSVPFRSGDIGLVRQIALVDGFVPGVPPSFRVRSAGTTRTADASLMHLENVGGAGGRPPRNLLVAGSLPRDHEVGPSAITLTRGCRNRPKRGLAAVAPLVAVAASPETTGVGAPVDAECASVSRAATCARVLVRRVLV
jgi:hypothetical protein